MKKKIIFVVCLLFGLMFINGGLNKLFHYLPVSDDMSPEMLTLMNAMSAMVWLMPLLAVAEIIGGILFIIPKTRPLGAIVVFPVVVGILLTHIVTDMSGLPVAIVLMAINLYVIGQHCDKYMALVR